MEELRKLTPGQKKVAVFMAVLVLALLVYLGWHYTQKDSYSSYYSPLGYAAGDGPMQQRWGGDPYGSQLAKHSQMDHTGAGCGCSSSLHDMAAVHQSGTWGRHQESMHHSKPLLHRRAAGGSTPSAVGLSDESLAMSIGSDGNADHQ